MVELTNGIDSKFGLIAILRGVSPSTVGVVAEALHIAGFRHVEVPLNSPQALCSIQRLRDLSAADLTVGAGTVLTPEQVSAAHASGATFIVSPNVNQSVIARSLELGLKALPGAATVTEAFEAVEAGATSIKLFPAPQVGPAALKAWLAVLPSGLEMIPVGGIGPDIMEDWLAIGATGFGVGSELYRPDQSIAVLRERAAAFVAAWNSIGRPIGSMDED